MTAVKTVNYSTEVSNQLAADYLAGATVADLATKFGRTARSITAKLAQLGVYQTTAKQAATSKATKAEIVQAVAAQLKLSNETLKTLEKADKSALEALFKAVVTE